MIVTGDTDTFQLIGPHVRVLTSRRQFGDTITYDEAGIRERYGLEPGQLIDYKALVGDKSDNVPGVAGIGEKTAVTLLQKYGSLEGIYDHLDEVSLGALPAGARSRPGDGLQEQVPGDHRHRRAGDPGPGRLPGQDAKWTASG